MTAPPRPHDLLRLSRVDGAAPQWVQAALSATPWVVVRRAEAPAGMIAVGVRGGRRAERYAMTVAAEDATETVPPEELAWRASRRVPAMRALDGIRAAVDRTGLRWGPTGSVGFELATGVPTATEESDLDLVVRVGRLTAEVLCTLSAMEQVFTTQAARIDCQIDTDCGAVALAELLADQPEILMRTATGPQLISRAVAVS